MEKQIGNSIIKDNLSPTPSQKNNLDIYDLESEFKFESEMKRREVKQSFNLWVLALEKRDKPTFALKFYLESLGVSKDYLNKIEEDKF